MLKELIVRRSETRDRLDERLEKVPDTWPGGVQKGISDDRPPDDLTDTLRNKAEKCGFEMWTATVDLQEATSGSGRH